MKFSFKFILFIYLFLKNFHNADVFQSKTYSINSEPQNLLWPHNCGLHQLLVSARELWILPASHTWLCKCLQQVSPGTWLLFWSNAACSLHPSLVGTSALRSTPGAVEPDPSGIVAVVLGNDGM